MKLDGNQQTGFKSKYSTTDHIHVINQLKQKYREYNTPLCVAFVDYEKAFDSVQIQAILTSLLRTMNRNHGRCLYRCLHGQLSNTTSAQGKTVRKSGSREE